MPDLEARGQDPQHVWRRRLPAQPVTLGRTTGESEWTVVWDRQISGLHATLRWENDRLRVQRRMKPTPTVNAIYFAGLPKDDFTIGIGERFVIGRTTFSVLDSQPAPPPLRADGTPLLERTCSPEILRQVTYQDANQRMEVLADLPRVISATSREEELLGGVLDVLLKGIPRADTAAVVKLVEGEKEDEFRIEVLHAQKQDGKSVEFQPSRKLAHHAIQRERQSSFYVWRSEPAHGREDYSVRAGVDWAICAPLPEEPTPGWGLYVEGQLEQPAGSSHGLSQEGQLKTDAKFAQLVAEIFGSLRQVQMLQRRAMQMNKFFPPAVRRELANRDMDEVLQRREADVTILFCDLRGSCHIHEQGQQDLLKLANRFSAVLDIMASAVMDQDGVIADFLGDAVIGFWGWPQPDETQVGRAARTALNLLNKFRLAGQEPSHVLHGFACGVGIAHGQAVAGRLGSLDQFKIDIFGPVVNLASRLESITKVFKAPILMDEASAQRLTREPGGTRFRCRRLARVRPAGMNDPVVINELLPPVGEAGALSDRKLRDYDKALEAFTSSRWDEALELLRHLPTDEPSRFLEKYIRERQGRPPAGFDGVVILESK